jgi:hypothetical protein
MLLISGLAVQPRSPHDHKTGTRKVYSSKILTLQQDPIMHAYVCLRRRWPVHLSLALSSLIYATMFEPGGQYSHTPS